jgi:LAS superfamily LD-carboxypeptidase LdcB
MIAGLLSFLLILLALILIFPAGRNEKESSERIESGADQHDRQFRSPGAGWTWWVMPKSGIAGGNLVLVNERYVTDPSLPKTVSVYENKTDRYLVKDAALSVTQETMTALNRWMDAFAAESGRTDVNIVAGWRSYDDQETLYDRAVTEKGQAYADAYLAIPGHSEHHTGLAVDLDTYDVESGTCGGFDGGGDYAWLVEHAWEYGFIQRYPPEKHELTGINYESWHFRYVGVPHACVMKTENLCLEEYIEYLRGYPFEKEHLYVEQDAVRYEIYYCKGTNLVLPETDPYTLSGNNVDGFIVTVSRSASSSFEAE